MINITNWTGLSLALALCLGMFGISEPASAAQTETNTWEVELDMFSGRPNPVLLLNEAEIAKVKDLVSQAGSTAAKDKAKVFPSVLGYRGLSVRERGRNDRAVKSETRIRGKDIHVQGGKTPGWRNAKDASLEQYLVDLALEKGTISKREHEVVCEEMRKQK
jgi:hypothetical protein